MVCLLRFVLLPAAACRREVMDAYLRDRAEKLGASVINGLMMRMEQPGGCHNLWVSRSGILDQSHYLFVVSANCLRGKLCPLSFRLQTLGVTCGSHVSCWVHVPTYWGNVREQKAASHRRRQPPPQRPRVPCPACPDPSHLQSTEADGPITLHYNKYTDGSKIGTPATLEVDMVIGADGANSRVAKEIDAGEYDYAIAFQERIRIPGECLFVCRRHCVSLPLSLSLFLQCPRYHSCDMKALLHVGRDSTAGPVCLWVERGSHARRESGVCAAVACCADVC